MLCIIRVCNQLFFFNRMSTNQILYRHLYAYADDDKLLVLAFKLILVYFQHTFYSLFDETVSTYEHLLN